MRGDRSLALLALGGAGVLAAAGCGTQHASAGPAPTATAGSVLAAAVTRTAAQTARITVTTAMAMQGMTVSFTESGAFDFAHSRGTVSMSSPVGITEVFVPPTMYIKMPAGGGPSLPKGKSWIAVGAGMPGDPAAAGLGGVLPVPLGAGNGDPADLLASLTAISGSVTKLGTATIRGVTVTEYRVTADLAKAAARLPGWQRAGFRAFAQSLGAGTVPVDVWVDSSNQVRRMREALHMPSGTPAGAVVTQTTDFYDFGVPVRVSAPPAAEVASLAQLIAGGPPAGGGGPGAATPPPVSGTLSPADAAAAEQAVRAFWTALGRNDPSAVAQTVLPAQRSCIRSLLGKGPMFTVTSLKAVSARSAGDFRASVLFTVRAHAAIDGTSIPVLPQGPGSQQWLVAAAQAGRWYVDLADSGDFAFGGACG